MYNWNFLDQSLLLYKFHGSDMWGMYFSASCEPLTKTSTNSPMHHFDNPHIHGHKQFKIIDQRQGEFVLGRCKKRWKISIVFARFERSWYSLFNCKTFYKAAKQYYNLNGNKLESDCWWGRLLKSQDVFFFFFFFFFLFLWRHVLHHENSRYVQWCSQGLLGESPTRWCKMRTELKKGWGKMTKVELLPTRDCEARWNFT